jgi:hypothetical protein
MIFFNKIIMTGDSEQIIHEVRNCFYGLDSTTSLLLAAVFFLVVIPAILNSNFFKYTLLCTTLYYCVLNKYPELIEEAKNYATEIAEEVDMKLKDNDSSFVEEKNKKKKEKNK